MSSKLVCPLHFACHADADELITKPGWNFCLGKIPAQKMKAVWAVCYSTQKSSPTTQEGATSTTVTPLFLPSLVIWREKCTNTNKFWPQKLKIAANLGIPTPKSGKSLAAA